MLPEIDLTEQQRAVLQSVFANCPDRIEKVGVYGSRVQARATKGSDVDLVVYGPVTDNDIALLRGDLEDSDLSIFADVVAFDTVTHAPLRAEISRWMKPLFDRADLAVR